MIVLLLFFVLLPPQRRVSPQWGRIHFLSANRWHVKPLKWLSDGNCGGRWHIVPAGKPKAFVPYPALLPSIGSSVWNRLRGIPCSLGTKLRHAHIAILRRTTTLACTCSVRRMVTLLEGSWLRRRVSNCRTMFLIWRLT